MVTYLVTNTLVNYSASTRRKLSITNTLVNYTVTNTVVNYNKKGAGGIPRG